MSLPPRPVAPGFKVTSRTIARLADIWRAVSYAMMDGRAWHELAQALEHKDLNAAFGAVPDFRSRTPRTQELLKRLVGLMTRELRDIFADSADAEYKRLRSNVRVMRKADEFGNDFSFGGIDNEGSDPLDRPFANRFAQVPHADYLDRRAVELVVDIGEEQRQLLREVIRDRWDPDKRPEALIRDIKWTVGLTDRERRAVENRRELLREQGMAEARLSNETERYSAKLHQARALRIARTEAVFAETAGRTTAWRVAQDDGTVPHGAGKEWVSSAGCCDDCRALDGQVVALSDSWVSTNPSRKRMGGRVEGPPLHPNCVCAVVLRVDFKPRRGGRDAVA